MIANVHFGKLPICRFFVVVFFLHSFSAFATADIYVSLGGIGGVAKYSNSGTPINQLLIHSIQQPTGIDVSGNNIFLADQFSQTIGQYNLDGTAINASLISAPIRPWGVADSGGNLYVTDNAGGTINEYGSNGTLIRPLVGGLHNPTAIVISENKIFVANFSGNANGTGSIGEYALDGTPINTQLIIGLFGPEGLVVLGNDIFVSESNGNNVREYTIGGLLVNASPFPVVGNSFEGLATDGTNLYVGYFSNGNVVGKFAPDGTVINAKLINTGAAGTIFGLAVTPEPCMLSIAVLVGIQSLLRRRKREN